MQHITQPRPDPDHKDFFEYRKIRDMRNNYLEQRGHGKSPEKFHVRADHFLHLFNDDFNLKDDKRMSRRTLQFYSSPQAQLLPLPVYKDRHTAYYVFPDHYERLGVIWTLRNKFFFPIELIRTLLSQISEDMYAMIMDWDETPEALLDTIMMDKAGFDPEDIEWYATSKGLLGDAVLRLQRPNFSEAAAKKAMIQELDDQYAGIKQWISSGRAIKFISALNEARLALPDFKDRLGDSEKKERKISKKELDEEYRLQREELLIQNAEEEE